MKAALAVAGKDLVSEWRSREMLPALAQFVVMAVVIAYFGFTVDGSDASAAGIGPGVVWLVLVFAGLLAFGRAFAAERELGSLEAMLLTPAGPAAIFAGKAIASGAVLIACEAVLVPAMAIFLGVRPSPLGLASIALATVGLSAVGCLFAALAAQTRARDLLLPVLALPVWLPFIVIGSRAVAGSGGLQGTGLLLDFDILFLVVSTLAARYVLED